MSLVITRGAEPGEILIRDGERVERMFAVAAGDLTWIFHDGCVFVIEDEPAKRARTRHAHGALTAPMPATVVRIKVSPGDEVKAGDTLIVLEAMKMELPVRAPGAGRVKAVHCRPGELVQPDLNLIELE